MIETHWCEILSMHQIVTSFSLKRETLISIFIYTPGIKLISAVVEASLSHKREILINILRYTLLRSLISADIVTRHFVTRPLILLVNFCFNIFIFSVSFFLFWFHIILNYSSLFFMFKLNISIIVLSTVVLNVLYS